MKLCDAFRDIALACEAGKVYHGILRTCLVPEYWSFCSQAQYGGVRHRGCDFGNLAGRSFHADCESQGLVQCCCVFRCGHGFCVHAKIKSEEKEDGNNKARKKHHSTNLHPTEKEQIPRKSRSRFCKRTPGQLISSERIHELFQEVLGTRWDVTLVSETRRPNKEMWESNQGQIVMESGEFDNKHGGVAIVVNSRWRQG